MNYSTPPKASGAESRSAKRLFEGELLDLDAAVLIAVLLRFL